MSEKGTKYEPAGFPPIKNAVVCNLSENEISHISMSERPMKDHTIYSFREKGEVLKNENRWALEFDYGSSQFVAYFTEEAAKSFVEQVNKSLGKLINQGT